MAITRLALPSIATLRDQCCQDIRRGKQRAGVPNPNVAAGSESYIKAEAFASSTFQVMAREVALQDATMPDRAVGDDLIRLAKVLRDIDPSLGAGATGNVVADCIGTVTYAVGTEWRSPDGLRYNVVSTTLATDGDPIPVRGVDVGKRTDKIAGTSGTWTSPPAGSSPTAVVDVGGLTAGADPDNDASLRTKLLDALRHPPSSGNAADFIRWAEEASAGVEKAFCYCADQGPGTVHVAFTVAPTAENAYSRAGSTALVNSVGLGIVASDPEHCDITTTTVDDTDVVVVLQVEMPEHEVDGGPGGTWLDPIALRWPACMTTPFASYVVSVTSPTRIRVSCLNVGSNAPVTASHSRIAIWSTLQKKFVHAQIETATYVSGVQYDLDLYMPIDTSAIAANDYISPDAERMDDYGISVAQMFAGLGPGEVTADALLLPRAARHPLQSEAWASSLTSVHIGQLSEAHGEILHVTVKTPTLPHAAALPSAVTDPPCVSVIGKLALYPL